MEFPNGKNNKLIVCLAEVFGTFILSISINYGAKTGGLAPALAQFVDCFFIGPISNAHINPAVTAGVFLNCGPSKSNFYFMLMIWFSQIFGAGLGCLWVRMSANVEDGFFISPNVADISVNKGFVDENNKIYAWDILCIEMFSTFMFVLACLSIGDMESNKTPLNAMAVALSLYYAI